MVAGLEGVLVAQIPEAVAELVHGHRGRRRAVVDAAVRGVAVRLVAAAGAVAEPGVRREVVDDDHLVVRRTRGRGCRQHPRGVAAHQAVDAAAAGRAAEVAGVLVQCHPHVGPLRCEGLGAQQRLAHLRRAGLELRHLGRQVPAGDNEQIEAAWHGHDARLLRRSPSVRQQPVAACQNPDGGGIGKPRVADLDAIGVFQVRHDERDVLLVERQDPGQAVVRLARRHRRNRDDIRVREALLVEDAARATAKHEFGRRVARAVRAIRRSLPSARETAAHHRQRVDPVERRTIPGLGHVDRHDHHGAAGRSRCGKLPGRGADREGPQDEHGGGAAKAKETHAIFSRKPPAGNHATACARSRDYTRTDGGDGRIRRLGPARSGSALRGTAPAHPAYYSL